ncbi:MAG: hypothetical protein KDD14_25485 [Saprospiraceae bacterium]|nr:hypothetical protein [Saprospiraceae bacterium]
MMRTGLRTGCFENWYDASLLNMLDMLEVGTRQATKCKHIQGKYAGEPKHRAKVVELCLYSLIKEYSQPN